MVAIIERLKSELVQLPLDQRAELAHFLIHSLDEKEDADAKAAWDMELQRRLEEIKNGSAVGEPAEEVFAEFTTEISIVKRAVIHADAKVELREAIDYYEQKKPGLGIDFRNEVEEAVLRIRENPNFGGRYKAEFRHVILERFPYVVYYCDLPEFVWIVAVAHAKRRPGYWKERRLGDQS